VGWREIRMYLAGATATGTVSGVVRSAREPVQGAEVELRAGNSAAQTVFTDNGGAYAFEGIPPGTYTVRAYAQEASSARRTESEPQTLEPDANLRVAPLVLGGR